MIKKPRIILIVLVCVIVIVEILFLRPTTVDVGEGTEESMFNSIETMIEAQKVKDDEVGYTINQFHYTAVEGVVKQWRMIAKEAILYQKSRLFHAKNARIQMFDPEGNITHIEGDEAKYRMDSRDMFLKGNVKVTFPDGFWLKTPNAYYSATSGVISTQDKFFGEAPPTNGELMEVDGTGFDAKKNGPIVNIHRNAHVRVRQSGAEEISDIRSDKSEINRFTKVAEFTMKNSNKFVKSHQGSLHVRSRRQVATYDSNSSVLKYLVAYDDVHIRETDPEKLKNGLKYATSQKAEFLTSENKILLSGFPSAYQAHDTVTGERIIIHRRKNLVEVIHANAYHEGRVQ